MAIMVPDQLCSQPSDFDRFRPIHIAGTKGKGSTSAFISWILAQYLPSTTQKKPLLQKIGLYTSPHLRHVRERMQINNEPLSEQAFAKYFFETWDRLEASARKKGEDTGKSAKPVYFRFLTIMAFHTFLSEGVDAAVIECGIGGEYDTTNVIEKPVCTGITSLGIDHTAILGKTIEEIAWHKAGIMKPGVPAFTSPQPPGALEVLHKRAKEASTSIEVVSNNPAISKVRLGLAGDFQKTNASLAIAVAGAFLNSTNSLSFQIDSKLPEEFLWGLESARLQGRCETRQDGQVTWYLDCGHTLESIEFAAKWFASQVEHAPSAGSPSTASTRILLFNQQTRDANALARALHSHLQTAIDDGHPFTHAVFCTNITFSAGEYKPDMKSMNVDAGAVESLEVQKALAQTWNEVDPDTEITIKKSIEEAIGWCKEVSEQAQGNTAVLVTGSVHLVGGVLEVLES